MNLIHLFKALILLIPLNSHAGVFGVGNSGDVSMQLSFAKTTAVSTLRHVDFKDLVRNYAPPRISNFYRQCRQEMYLGALRTEFQLVEEIDDSNGFHAVARRISKKTILISRRQLEYLASNGTLTSTFMTGLVLHEVGHDCTYKGKPVDDRFDGLLDVLAQNLILLSTKETFNHQRHMTLLQRVKSRKKVTSVHIPQQLKSKLVKKYIDYIGDLAYQDLGADLDYRPIPASRYYESLSTNIFKSWSQIDLTPFSKLRNFRETLIEPPLNSDNFSYKAGSEIKPLRTKLTCVPKIVDGIDNAVCALLVYWPKRFHNITRSIQIGFSTNVFGQFSVDTIKPFRTPSRFVTSDE